TIKSLRRISFGQYRADGVLTVYPENKDGIPFRVLRVFTVAGVSANGVRGNHAHRSCSQMLACLAGQVNVEIKDGFDTTTDRLVGAGAALLLPPMLWNSVAFEGPSTVLLVFCDESYDEFDYLRDWSGYVQLKRAERGFPGGSPILP